MKAIIFALSLLFAAPSFAQEPSPPQCDMAARISHIQQRHKTIADTELVNAVMAKVNAIEPVTDYKADTIFLVEAPHDMVEVVFVLHDCVVSGMILPLGALKAMLDSVGSGS